MPFLAFIGLFAASFFVWMVGTLWGGYVLTILWGWFIVPTFNLPSLSLASAIGVAMVIGYLIYRPNFNTDYDIDDWTKMIGRGFVSALIHPLFALFLGWIVHFFM